MSPGFFLRVSRLFEGSNAWAHAANTATFASLTERILMIDGDHTGWRNLFASNPTHNTVVSDVQPPQVEIDAEWQRRVSAEPCLRVVRFRCAGMLRRAHGTAEVVASSGNVTPMLAWSLR